MKIYLIVHWVTRQIAVETDMKRAMIAVELEGYTAKEDERKLGRTPDVEVIEHDLDSGRRRVILKRWAPLYVDY